MQGLHRVSFMSLIVMLAACSNHDDHNHSELITGQDLYNHHCAECHGKDGTGQLAERMPANILTKKGNQGIADYIRGKDNNPDREMPVFATMPYAEAKKIANHLLVLRQKYDKTPEEKKKPRGLLIEP